MKTIPERIFELRAAILSAGCDAYIIPSSDPHSSEYAPAHYTSWEYFTGFPCENSTLVVTADTAALWIDGRFFGAADSALEGTGILSMHMGTKDVKDADDWLAEKLKEGQTLGYTAENMPLGRLRKLEKKLKKGVILKACHCDDEAWTEDRPALPATTAWILEEKYSGLNTEGKLKAVREKLDDCDSIVITMLDDIAWLMNLRADDVGCTPYALCFCYVSKEKAVLFIDKSRVPAGIEAALNASGVELMPYEGFPGYLDGISEKTKVMIAPKSINAALYNSLKNNPNCTVKEANDPVQLLKAVKNSTEISCTKRAHLADAAAMVRFQIELEKRLKAGETLRELDVCDMLVKYRSMDSLFIETSFGTIAAYGPNAAMMHYDPAAGVDSEIGNKGFLLVDCGGTYYDGTTDITRTYTVGPMTEQEKEMYTLTLRAHIDIAMAVWKAGMKGGQLDMLSRQPFWSALLDYRCGTGHGVSHVGAVHEGPQSLSPVGDVPFEPGMIVTDEPGYYEDGVVGIRIENELLCVEAGESEYGKYLKFEPVTYVPINLEPVIVDELNARELKWLNDYHAAVYEKVSPLLNDEEKAWLKIKCAPLAG